MSGQVKGSFESRVLTDGSKFFHLRFQLNGKRETVVLHERPGCPCGCVGGWEEAAARAALGELVAWARVDLRCSPTLIGCGRRGGRAVRRISPQNRYDVII